MASETHSDHLELPITGITCASCVSPVERKLSERDGVQASVDYVRAFRYNVAALPVPAAGLLNPLLAGVAMALSSVSVVADGLRLRGFTAEHGGDAADPSDHAAPRRSRNATAGPAGR